MNQLNHFAFVDLYYLIAFHNLNFYAFDAIIYEHFELRTRSNIRKYVSNWIIIKLS